MATENCTLVATENCTLLRGRQGPEQASGVAAQGSGVGRRERSERRPTPEARRGLGR